MCSPTSYTFLFVANEVEERNDAIQRLNENNLSDLVENVIMLQREFEWKVRTVNATQGSRSTHEFSTVSLSPSNDDDVANLYSRILPCMCYNCITYPRLRDKNAKCLHQHDNHFRI